MPMALTHIAYFSVIILLMSVVPQGTLGEINAVTNTLLIVGFLGMWRYTWALINFGRAIVFRRWHYPRWTAAARKRFDASGVKSHCYFMVTTYMVDNETTMMVYRRLFEAAANARDGATVVASIVAWQGRATDPAGL